MSFPTFRHARLRRVALLLAIVLIAIAAGFLVDREPAIPASVADAATGSTVAPPPLASPTFGAVPPAATDVPVSARRADFAPIIKTTPAAITDYDGTEGSITIDPAALEALKPGDYLVTHLGEFTVAHRVNAKEKRDGHTYIPLTVVDPLTGEPMPYHGAFHAYEGRTNYYFNSEHGAFDVMAVNGQSTRFKNFHAMSQNIDGDEH